MPSTVTCSCVKSEPFPGFIEYQVTVTFNYAPTPGHTICTLPQPKASIFIGTVEGSASDMTDQGGGVWKRTATMYSAPSKAKVYFKEITVMQDVESAGCPCTRPTVATSKKKKKKR